MWGWHLPGGPHCQSSYRFYQSIYHFITFINRFIIIFIHLSFSSIYHYQQFIIFNNLSFSSIYRFQQAIYHFTLSNYFITISNFFKLFLLFIDFCPSVSHFIAPRPVFLINLINQFFANKALKDVALGDVALGDVALRDLALREVALGDVALGDMAQPGLGVLEGPFSTQNAPAP